LNNLPAPLMQLIGRDEVISRVSAQLAHHRLITLVGPGGIGKTSVAIATAEGMTESYDHGVWFVDLTAISDPTLLAKALGSAIRLGPSAEDPFARLLSFSEGQADAPRARQLRAYHIGPHCFGFPGAADCSLCANPGDEP
jgi:hypothetical protein